jgi:putative phosphoesterase
VKIFFMSDMHGSLNYSQKALDNFTKEGADYIVILGDELYHGARNPLSQKYSTLETAALLNKFSDRIIAVRGNCDSEIDAMVLNYPMMSDYSVVLYNKRRLFLTHGHIYSVNNIPKLNVGDIFFYGHIHVPKIEKIDGIYAINPGSVTFPKENNPHTYGILEDNIFRIKDLEGNIFKEIELE